MKDRCVVCGKDIPEGRQVCPECENKEDSAKRSNGKKQVAVWMLIVIILDILACIPYVFGYENAFHKIYEIVLIMIFADAITDWIFKKE